MQHTAEETLNTTMEPVTTESNTSVRNTTENWNSTMQRTAAKILNTTVSFVANTKNATVQPAITKPTDSIEQPATSVNTTMKVMGADDVNATVQPTRTENPDVTSQPMTKENPIIAITTTVQPKPLNATLQHIVEENENTTAAAQPTTTKRLNYTVQPTTSETLNATLEQPYTVKRENQSMMSTTGQRVNTTMHPSITETVIKVTEKKVVHPWGPWTPCSRTCGMGFKVRARPCNQDTDGKDCLNNSTQVSICIIQPCKKIPPTWSPWGAWTECSSSCGIGVRVRIRSCRNSDVVLSECIGRRFEVGFCRNTNCVRQGFTATSSSESSSIAEVSASVPARKTVIISPAVYPQSITAKVLPSSTGSMLHSFVQPTKAINVPLMATTFTLLPCQGRACLSTNVAEYAVPATLATTLSSTALRVDSKINRKDSSSSDLIMSSSSISSLSSTSSSWKSSSPSTASALSSVGLGITGKDEVLPSKSSTLPSSTIVVPKMSKASQSSLSASITPSPSISVPSTFYPTPFTSAFMAESTDQSIPTSSSSVGTSSGVVSSEPTLSTTSSLSEPTSSAMSSLSEPTPSATSSLSESSSPLSEPTSSTAPSSPAPPMSSSSLSPSVTLRDKSVLLSSTPLRFSKSFSSLPLSSTPTSSQVSSTSSSSTSSSSSSSTSSSSVLSSTSSVPSMPAMLTAIPASSSLHQAPTSSSLLISSTSSPLSIADSLQSMVTSSHTSMATSIKPSRTVGLLQKSSSITLSGQTGSSRPEKCPLCRTSRKKNKLFCKSDYAIHVNVTQTFINSNNKPIYDLYVVKTYKNTQPIPKRLYIRVPGQKCPCPYLETGKEYVIFGKLRTKKKGQLRVMFNRRNFVEEWVTSFDEEVISLKKHCASTGSKVTVQPTKLKTPTQPTPTTIAMTTTTPTNSCPSCRMPDNLEPIYCSSDYAIRAKVTKYRLATNRTMYYANLITTYKTSHQLPYEVLIRVAGEHCPCPHLAVGVEYLMVGTMKETFTGKMRLSLTLNSFVKKWSGELEEILDAAKKKCGLPVVLGPPDPIIPTTEGTTLSTQQKESTQTTTAIPTTMTTITMTTTTEPATEKPDVLCPFCSTSKIGETQQRRYCKNNQVIRGRVLSSYETQLNRTFYLVAMVTTFKSTIEIPDQTSTRVAENACLCGKLSVGKDYLIMGRVKVNKKGKSRMVLTRKSFVQDWEESFYQRIEHMETQCGNPVLEVKNEKLTVTNGVPFVTTPVTEKGPSTEPSKTPLVSDIFTKGNLPVVSTKKTGTCPPCSVSYNIQDFCSNEYVFRAKVFKLYSTSANRTVYHANVINTYKSPGPTDSVVLLRVPGIECHCPQMRVGIEYVVMGYLRKKRKGPSIMTLSRGSFVQPWNEGFVEELQSLRSSCNSSEVDVGSLVQLITDSGSEYTTMTSSIEKNSVTMPTSVPTLPFSTRDVMSAPPTTLISTGNDVVMTTPSTHPERKCPPCQTSKKRNRMYCISDVVLAVEIQERVHNTTTKITQYYATIQYKYKQQTPLDPLVVIAVRNDACNCPNLQTKQSYVVMANIEYMEKGAIRLVLPQKPFIKLWSKGFHKKILRLEKYCSTGHRKL